MVSHWEVFDWLKLQFQRQSTMERIRDRGPVADGDIKPLDVATLNKLYPTHDDYVSAVERVTNENLKGGFILKADAESTIRAAKESMIGRFDSVEAEREVPISGFDRNP